MSTHGVHITNKRGLYYWRRRLPGPRPLGELMVALGTRRYREAEHLGALIDRAFPAAWRRALSETTTDTDLKRVLREYLRRALDTDAALRLERPAHSAVYAHWWERGDAETLEAADLRAIREARASLARDLAANVVDDLTEHEASVLLGKHGIPAHHRRALAVGMMEAALRAWDVAERRTLGLEPVVFTKDAPGTATLPSAAQAPPSKAPAPLASELLDGFMQHVRQGEVRGQTEVQYRAAIALFIKSVGDKPIDQYTGADSHAHYATLRQLPSDYNKLGRGDDGRTVPEIIARGLSEGKGTFALRTLQRHKVYLRAFMEYAYNLGYVDERAKEFADGWRLPKKVRASHEERQAWAPEQLVALFGCAVWRGSRSEVRPLMPGPTIYRTWRFWLPLLCLFQGLRLEEACQLLREDVRKVDGIWCLDINDKPPRQLKNTISRRLIPLHPEVIRIGFVGYLSTLPEDTTGQMFPQLSRGGPDKKLSTYPTRSFATLRGNIGITDLVGYQSMRHNANTGLLRAGVPPHVVARLLGRIIEGGGETMNRYYQGEAARANFDYLARLAYPEVDLSHLHVPGADADLPT